MKRCTSTILAAVVAWAGISPVLVGAQEPARDLRAPTAAAQSIDQFVLDGQYAGPFKDTVVQRWVDRITGNVCYFYIPVVVPGVPNTGNAPGQPRVYGPNGIGSISCVPRASKP